MSRREVSTRKNLGAKAIEWCCQMLPGLKIPRSPNSLDTLKKSPRPLSRKVFFFFTLVTTVQGGVAIWDLEVTRCSEKPVWGRFFLYKVQDPQEGPCSSSPRSGDKIGRWVPSPICDQRWAFEPFSALGESRVWEMI